MVSIFATENAAACTCESVHIKNRLKIRRFCLILSSRKCYKPGSVSPVLQAGRIPRTKSGSHLSMASEDTIRPFRLIPSGRFPYQIWVSRSQGLPRSIFSVARKATFLWHFQRTRASERALSTPSARLAPHCPGLRQVRTLQASQLGRAWTFLYRQSPRRLRQRLPAFPAFQNQYYILYHTAHVRSTSRTWNVPIRSFCQPVVQ